LMPAALALSSHSCFNVFIITLYQGFSGSQELSLLAA